MIATKEWCRALVCQDKPAHLTLAARFMKRAEAKWSTAVPEERYAAIGGAVNRVERTAVSEICYVKISNAARRIVRDAVPEADIAERTAVVRQAWLVADPRNNEVAYHIDDGEVFRPRRCD